MPNPYFRFKQFTIHQDKCAMKVTTDACLFGAWLADNFAGAEFGGDSAMTIDNVLEIGTGTGVLSLMLAQKREALIDTIEIDAIACEQAKENIAASTWKHRIRLICCDAKHLTVEKKYDLIFSNPPFFENQLRSENKRINMARHDDTLNFDEIINIVCSNLSSKGVFALLLPYHRSDYFINLANTMNFQLHTRVDIKQSTNHTPFRSILYFGKQSIKTDIRELIIKDGEKYTKEFAVLLKDYYLNL